MRRKVRRPNGSRKSRERDEFAYKFLFHFNALANKEEHVANALTNKRNNNRVMIIRDRCWTALVAGLNHFQPSERYALKSPKNVAQICNWIRLVVQFHVPRLRL